MFVLYLFRQNMYTIAQIETLTGITSHTLRIWERRYDFIQPERTDTNIRQYGEDDLRKLLNIGILLSNGSRVSSINKLTDTEIKEKVEEVFTSKVYEHASVINAFVLSMLELDELKFHDLFNSSVESIGFKRTVIDVLYPFLSRVGGLWTTDKVVPAEEHFVSNLIRQKLLSAIDKLPQSNDSSKSIIMFLPMEEHHEMGLLFANYLARKQGWRVYYFGQNLPINNLPSLVNKLQPNYLLTFFILPRVSRVQYMIKEIVKSTNTPLLVSGNSANFKEEVQNVRYLKNPEELLTVLV